MKAQFAASTSVEDKEKAVKKKGLFEDSDEDSDEEEKKDKVAANVQSNATFSSNIQPPPLNKNSMSAPLVASKTMPRNSAQPVQSAESGEFKNSLESLLAKGNPLMPGVARKQTVVKQKPVEEEREKIRFDVFADEDPSANKYTQSQPVLDNVSASTFL